MHKSSEKSQKAAKINLMSSVDTRDRLRGNFVWLTLFSSAYVLLNWFWREFVCEVKCSACEANSFY